MANDLAIKIVVDNTEAKTKLAETDRAIDAIKGSAGSTGQALSTYDQQVQAVVKSKQALTLVSGSVFDQLEATRQATNAAAIANMTLFESINRNEGGLRGMATSARDAWVAFREAGGLSGLMERLGEATGITAANLGVLGTAGAVFGTFVATFSLTRMILEFTQLDGVVGRAGAALMRFGWPDAAKLQAAAAAQDAINLAIARGGQNINTQADALRFNTQWVQNSNTAWKEFDDTQARAKGFQHTSEAMAAWRAEIDKVSNEGALDQLISDMNTGLFSSERLTKEYRISGDALKLLQTDLKKQAEGQRAATEDNKRYAAELKRARDEATRSLEKETQAHLQNIRASEQTGEAAGRAISQQMRGQNVLRDLSVQMGTTQLAARNLADKGIAYVGDISEATAAKVQALTDDTQDALAGMAYDLNVLSRVFEHMGGPMDVVGGLFRELSADVRAMSQGEGGFGGLKQIADDWEHLSTVQKAATATLIGLSAAQGLVDEKSRAGQTISYAKKGAEIGSVAGPYGALAGAAIGAIIGALKVPKLELEGRNIEKQFEQSMGGWQGVQKALLATGLSADEVNFKMTRLWNAEKQGGEAVKKVIDEITAALDAQKQDEADLQAAIERYHFSIEELGPAMQKQKLDEQAKDLMNDWRLLVGSGIELSKVNEHMADSINEYLQLAIKTGMEVPASMKPIIDGLEKQGLLTEDLKDIKWAETMAQGFDRVVDALNKLLEGLDLIPRKARDAGQAIEDIPPAPGNDGRDNQRFHAGGQVLPFVPRAHRGLALDEVPIIALRGEGVLNRGAMRRIGGAAGLNAMNAGGGSGGASVVWTGNVYVDGDLNSQAARRKVARDVNSALQGLVLERRRGSAR